MYSEEQWFVKGRCIWCNSVLWAKGWGIGEQYRWEDESSDCLHEIEGDVINNG